MRFLVGISMAFRVSFFYREGGGIPFQIGILGEKDPHPLIFLYIEFENDPLPLSQFY